MEGDKGSVRREASHAFSRWVLRVAGGPLRGNSGNSLGEPPAGPASSVWQMSRRLWDMCGPNVSASPEVAGAARKSAARKPDRRASGQPSFPQLRNCGARQAKAAGQRHCFGVRLGAVFCLVIVWGLSLPACVEARNGHRADITAVEDLSAKLAGVVRTAACNTLRSGGVGCGDVHGAQDALQALHARAKAYTPETIKLQEMLKTTILPQIEDVFQNASRMLIVR